ncbi:MAG: CoA-binding protein [Bacteroidales bacterium]|jgi:predicted CoA-binding protein|nr:CoA-binding protein [Bacteroidales bacterium]MDD4673359.1 CoA-binding protein [Bacteroidales bacterium]MDY0349497.1 CoA-binding protein [Tenuifilaceae bacterium]
MRNKTLIIGASLKPERYSYKAAESLLAHGHEIYMIGNRAGTLFDHEITKSLAPYKDVDTVTLYLSEKNQEKYCDYIVSLKPRRVIFNPGTENSDFVKRLEGNGIAADEACTLVLLATDQY